MLITTTDRGTLLHSLKVAPPWESIETQTHKLLKNDLQFLLELRSGAPYDDAPVQEQKDFSHTLTRFGLTRKPSAEHVSSISGSAGNGITNWTVSIFRAVVSRLGLPRKTDVSQGFSSLDSTLNDPADPADLAVNVNQAYLLKGPVTWEVTPEGFICTDHDGAPGPPVSVGAVNLAEKFVKPTSLERLESDLAIDEPSLVLQNYTAELKAVGLLEPIGEPKSIKHLGEVVPPKSAFFEYHARFARRREKLTKLHEHSLPASFKKLKLYFVLINGWTPPLSLGMIRSHACVWNEGKLGQSYDLFPRWVGPWQEVAPFGSEPTIFLFSDYIWSHDKNLEFSQRIKETNPNAITIHGGPDCPTYREDAERYFTDHPYVDIAVRGEGEETICEVLDALAPGLLSCNVDLGVLESVPGLTYRSQDGEVILTAPRDRLSDLNVIPSPFLDGTFDLFEDEEEIYMVVVETNRGCPYGCTFCDWGSATKAKIRCFELQRVFEELEWCARNRVQQIFVADANFGIFPRDVEIAQHVAELRKQHGYPKRFITNYAKNSVKYLRHIVEIISSAGILTEGLLSLQSMDDETLTAIRRSNIKTEKYDELASEFRANKLPLFVDLMMGLPGQTIRSLQNDLQLCVDKEVLAKCHGTELLVNSPMNDPVYRKDYAIEVSRPPGPAAINEETSVKPRDASLVISSSTFSREDYHDMHSMRRVYLLCENLGVLRYLARYVRSKTGMPEVAFYESWRTTVQAEPWAWPVSCLTASIVPSAMVPPVSWAKLMAEMERFCVEHLSLEPGSELDSALKAQHAVLPTPRRVFPDAVDLPHNFSAWHETVLSLKLGDHPADWEEHAPQLSTFGPATLEVRDPTNVSNRAMGKGSAIAAYVDWELESDISRPAPGHHQM